MGLFNCLHPRTIITAHGNFRRVRCGCCEACTTQKGLCYSQQCKMESAAHRYTMFVTLTYDNDSLPVARYFSHHGNLFFFNATPRLDKRLRVMRGAPFLAVAAPNQLHINSMGMYHSKFALPDSMSKDIPYLAKPDLQLFLKRLRYYISKFSNEKIRYFATGEYGPVHYRPHFHLLLWYDDSATASRIGEAIHSSWHYGRVDYSLSKGKTASYVAQYANGLSTRSRLHQLKNFRPFTLHSCRLFGHVYKSEIEAPYEIEFSDVARKVFNDNGRLREIAPLLSFESMLFPKCVNFDNTSFSDHYVCYQFLYRAIDEYGDLPVSRLASLIWNDYDGNCHTMLQRLTFDSRFTEETIKSVLYTSKKFIGLCRTYHVSPRTLVHKIEEYYKQKDYYNLTCQLVAQEEFMQNVQPENRLFFLYFYDNFDIDKTDDIKSYPTVIRRVFEQFGVEQQFITDSLFSLDCNPMFKEFRTFYKKLSSDMVKHKKLNDLNKIFLYG